ncbi:MAG TPA: FG-GAP-like repeat-containing protein [Pyrinomonadaceae bacterium]|nr:FG-GAP-like repeat-containing protein [Pyrinomonadaceae bacterium]HMP64952.1 FG-GAP-like repeat-containing protein [Pyrinomonadaceae bacterium]
MTWKNRARSPRSAFFVLAIVAVFAITFILSGGETLAESKIELGRTVSNAGGSPVSFPANGATLGGIPDRGAAGCGPPSGPARDVTFTVSGITAPLTTVQLGMTISHTWVGDVGATLIAPNGTSHVVFFRTEATSATSCGDSSDLAGPYLFTDTPSCPAACVNWWDEAFFRTATQPLTAGDYQTTAPGPDANPPAPETLMTPAFAGVPDPNGTWTLRLVDFGGGDVGTITAANLILAGGGGGPAPNGPVDYDGDGISDYAFIRNEGGGPTTQLTWYWYESSTGNLLAALWGWGLDFILSGDFDGDGKDDIAVWRPGAEAHFYILNSSDFTARVEQFGTTGDDPSVVADYNGDGVTDIAVYREGLNPGDQSTWFYRTVPEGPTTFVPWGRNGDFAAPGDYDGDGSADFVVQRGEGGAGVFWLLYANGSSGAVQFGTENDIIVPGDYDGDGATDIAVIRTTGGIFTWWILPSGNPAGAFAVQWGSLATDDPAQGDYDGDGRTDIAIFRDGAFWVLNSSDGSATIAPVGAPGDIAVASYNFR